MVLDAQLKKIIKKVQKKEKTHYEIYKRLSTRVKDENNRKILKDVARRTHSYFVGAGFDFTDVMEVLRGAKFLFSGRFHHLIFSSIVGCPAILLRSSSHKIDGLAELLSPCRKAPFDPTDLWSSGENIQARAKAIVSAGESLRHVCVETASHCRRRVYRQGQMINEVLTGAGMQRERKAS